MDPSKVGTLIIDECEFINETSLEMLETIYYNLKDIQFIGCSIIPSTSIVRFAKSHSFGIFPINPTMLIDKKTIHYLYFLSPIEKLNKIFQILKTVLKSKKTMILFKKQKVAEYIYKLLKESNLNAFLAIGTQSKQEEINLYEELSNNNNYFLLTTYGHIRSRSIPIDVTINFEMQKPFPYAYINQVGRVGHEIYNFANTDERDAQSQIEKYYKISFENKI